ncbi:DUF1853 family protein [uncultured Microbulbifer sp.]|uniref:DUF1853 family protein n=1 Tax=uncultured Microbulbifer sp. TaxID=348147 RepID=UPI0026144D2B|nr:DUF1853 family protein [uncultured Microbulbifer sp.]
MRNPTKSILPSHTPDHWQNLLWALSADDIAPDYPLPWLPAARRQALHSYFSSAEIYQQLYPQLPHFLAQFNSHRLGIYFENLWAFAFQHHPDYTLRARNLPIRHEGKTLGELDFLVHHHPDDMLEHWELAVKFYLQVDKHWMGPGLRDRLDIKLARMREHQLPIAQSPEVQSQLALTGLTPQRQWTRMPGRLFTPLQEGSPEPAHHWWADTAQFLQCFSSSGYRWVQLPKQTWLTSCGIPDPITAQPLALHAIDLQKLHHQLNDRGPLCVAATDDSGEISRGFIVPDDWRQRASSELASAK